MSGEKTEQPTPKRLRDARRKGQVAQSKEVVSAALMVAIFGLLLATAGFLQEKFAEMLLLPPQLYAMPFGDAAKRLMDMLFDIAIVATVPFLLVLLAVGIGAHVLQFGFLFAPEGAKPSLEKINPVKAIQRIFSIRNLVEFLKSIAKVGFLSALLWIVVRDALDPLLKAPACGLDCISALLGHLFLKVAAFTTAAFIAIAAFDFFFQKFQHLKQLRMSKDEVKREYKEMEGDPMIKGQRRQLHQQLLMNDQLNNVKRASVVVTNPTHIAVALFYKDDETPLPTLLAKGQDLMAARIVEIARREGVPVMENVPLARSLYEEVEIDRYIPSHLIEPVAEVLRWVRELEGDG